MKTRFNNHTIKSRELFELPEMKVKLENKHFSNVNAEINKESYSISKTLKIKNRLGLHARAAARLAKAAEPFDADIYLIRDTTEVDAKSILSLLMLGCPYDTEVKIKAKGCDAKEAVYTLSSIIDESFGEE